MIKELREKFNSTFDQANYEKFIHSLNTAYKYPVDFRVSETPLFLSNELTAHLQTACREIVAELQTKEFIDKSLNSVPKGADVPNGDDHPKFLQIDFALCKDEQEGIVPRLIELQGFPSLYCFQYLLNQKLKQYFPILSDLTCYFNNVDDQKYIGLLRETIVGDSDPENVILLEIEPENQKTRIDFAATEDLLGIRTVCLSKVIKRGKKLFYSENSKEIPVERIYNRVIFDELERKNLRFGFSFSDELDVEWVGHPNWFFRISKYSLPLLKSKYVPRCYYLNEIDQYPDDLSQFVLKPLFSFAGLGVDVDPDKKKLDAITDRSNYILQEKIEYAPLIKTPDEYSKVEIRMMFLWNNEPMLVNNLIRMSKGKMMGVDYNKNKTWVGSSAAYHQ